MWQNGSKWFPFWAVFETKQRRKEVLRTLLSEIDPYTLKVGDLSGDLAVLPLPTEVPLLQHIYSSV